VERQAAFGKWVTSFFAHGDLSTKDFSQFELRTPIATKPNTESTFTPEEKDRIYDQSGYDEVGLVSAFFGSDFPVRYAQEVFVQNTELLAPKITVLYCEESVWECIYSSWVIEEVCEKAREEGKTPREFTVRSIKEANHYPQWLDPKLFLDSLKECL